MAIVGGGPLGVESLEVGGAEITADLGDELVGWDHGGLVWGRCGVWSAVEMCFGREEGRDEGRKEGKKHCGGWGWIVLDFSW